MPRSKRNKQIELAKTKKRGLEWKKRLFEEVRSCVDKYENVFVFSVNDMRNNKMKSVREQWKHSRFFIGKNKIMAMALGRFVEEEYKPNLHKLGQQIKGQRGLLFSNKPVEEVLSWFRSYSEGDYARSGNTATLNVYLHAGPLTMFPHNLEPYLRQLGLPTALEKGVIHLIKDHEVCKEGDILSPEAAKILKLLGHEMAEFHLAIDCVWSKDGTFMQLTESIDAGVKENKKQKKLSLSSEVTAKNNAAEVEQMEIEQHDEEISNDDDDDDDDDDDEDKNEESKEIPSDNQPDVVKSSLTSIITTTSTPKVKSNDVTENGVSYLKEKENKSILECNMKEIPEKIDDKNNMQEISVKIGDNSIEEMSEKIDDNNSIEEMSEKIDDKNSIEEMSEEIDDKNSVEEISEKNGDKNSVEEMLEKTGDKNNTEELPENIDDKNHVEEISEKNNDKASEISEDKARATKKGRPRVSAKTPKSSKKEMNSKRESLVKTPDANTSQDSPVFRELRTRSVKFSRKKK